MATTKATVETFDELIKADNPVAVKFSATWCGPCRLLGPIFEKLSDEYEGRVNFVTVDVDDQRPLCSRFGVTAVPLTVIFNDGEEVKRFSGAVTREDLTDYFEALIQ